MENPANEKMVLVDRRETFALVTLNRAEKQNFIDAAMIDELSRVFTALQNDQTVRAIILTGAGKDFSSGTGTDELSATTTEQARNFSQTGQALTCLIENLGKPVIAAVNGEAFGRGCELALACAWRIASSRAKFALPEVKSGLSPGFGGAARLSRTVGKSRALEMILLGKPVSSDDALRIGLVNRLVEEEDLLATCQELARLISQNAPLAIKYAIEAVNNGSGMSLADGLRLESALFGLCFATEDVQEGAKAFLEKRSPIFRGK